MNRTLVHDAAPSGEAAGRGPGRAAALGALAFLVLVLAQNVVRSAEPGFDASAAGVIDYVAGHRTAMLVPLCLFPVEMLALLTFVAGLRTLARDTTDRFWMDLGTLAVLCIAGLFAVVNATEVAIVALVGGGRDVPQAVAALWGVHAGAFGLNLGAIAIALVALSRAALHLGLVPAWVARVALPGAACLFAGAMSAVPVAEGSRMLLVAAVGFLVWALFLLTCALGLLGSHARPATSDAATGPRSMNTVIHAAFRRDLRRFDAALAAFPPGSRARAEQLHRAWRHYADQLHQHHEGEEEVFFPALASVEDVRSLVDDLEGEHAALLEALAGADAAVDGLRTDPGPGGVHAAREALARFHVALEEHLAHEEQAFEPLAARHARSPQMHQAEREIRARHRDDRGAFFAWLLDGATPAESAALRRLVPPPVLRTATLLGGRTYRTTVGQVWQ